MLPLQAQIVTGKYPFDTFIKSRYTECMGKKTGSKLRQPRRDAFLVRLSAKERDEWQQVANVMTGGNLSEMVRLAVDRLGAEQGERLSPSAELAFLSNRLQRVLARMK